VGRIAMRRMGRGRGMRRVKKARRRSGMRRKRLVLRRRRRERKTDVTDTKLGREGDMIGLFFEAAPLYEQLSVTTMEVSQKKACQHGGALSVGRRTAAC
jgi:hypothetical protein